MTVKQTVQKRQELSDIVKAFGFTISTKYVNEKVGRRKQIKISRVTKDFKKSAMKIKESSILDYHKDTIDFIYSSYLRNICNFSNVQHINSVVNNIDKINISYFSRLTTTEVTRKQWERNEWYENINFKESFQEICFKIFNPGKPKALNTPDFSVSDYFNEVINHSRFLHHRL